MSDKPYWNIRSNNISSDDLQRMVQILDKTCPKLAKDFCETLAHINALQKKCGLPLDALIWGTYDRQFINNGPSSRFTVQSFIDNYPLFNHYKAKDPLLFATFAALIPVLHKRFASAPSLTDIPLKIDDDLNQIIDMQTAFSITIQMSMNSTEVDSLVIGGLPIRFDWVLLPRNMVTVNDEDDDDDDSKQQNDIGDLQNELEAFRRKTKGKFKYYHHQIANSNDITWSTVYRTVFNNARTAFGIEKFKRNKRYVVVVDRREKYCNEFIDIYMFRVPGQQFHPQYYEYLSLMNFYFSERFLLPKCNGNHIALYDNSYDMLCLSYNLISEEDTNVYCHFNGFQLRFQPEDMVNVWPLFFVDKQHEISISSYNNVLTQRFKSEQFDTFYRDTTRSELPLAIITESNRHQVSIAPDNQEHELAVTTVTETKENASDSDTETENDGEDNGEKTLETLCQYIKRQMSREWSDVVQQVVAVVMEEFEELEEVIDDINSGTDSELLMCSDETQFHQQLQSTIQTYVTA